MLFINQIITNNQGIEYDHSTQQQATRATNSSG